MGLFDRITKMKTLTEYRCNCGHFWSETRYISRGMNGAMEAGLLLSVGIPKCPRCGGENVRARMLKL